MIEFYQMLMKLPYHVLCEILDNWGVYHHPTATQAKLASLIVSRGY